MKDRPVRQLAIHNLGEGQAEDRAKGCPRRRPPGLRAQARWTDIGDDTGHDMAERTPEKDLRAGLLQIGEGLASSLKPAISPPVRQTAGQKSRIAKSKGAPWSLAPESYAEACFACSEFGLINPTINATGSRVPIAGPETGILCHDAKDLRIYLTLSEL